MPDTSSRNGGGRRRHFCRHLLLRRPPHRQRDRGDAHPVDPEAGDDGRRGAQRDGVRAHRRGGRVNRKKGGQSGGVRETRRVGRGGGRDGGDRSER